MVVCPVATWSGLTGGAVVLQDVVLNTTALDAAAEKAGREAEALDASGGRSRQAGTQGEGMQYASPTS